MLKKTDILTLHKCHLIGQKTWQTTFLLTDGVSVSWDANRTRDPCDIRHHQQNVVINACWKPKFQSIQTFKKSLKSFMFESPFNNWLFLIKKRLPMIHWRGSISVWGCDVCIPRLSTLRTCLSEWDGVKKRERCSEREKLDRVKDMT